MGVYRIKVSRAGIVTELQGAEGKSLLDQLLANDIYVSAPCGGKGRCGKCGVLMLSGATPITEADEKFFDTKALNEGWRLSCYAYPEADCELMLEADTESEFDVLGSNQDEGMGDVQAEQDYAVAIDIGSTTIAISLVGNTSKKVLHTVTEVNRQRAFGADVISRIQASIDGKKAELQESIRKDLSVGIKKLLEEAGGDIAKLTEIVIAGNTTMEHLFMGYPCDSLGVFPFTPYEIGTIKETIGSSFPGSFPETEADIPVTLLPGISTYVGADISAGMLATGFDRSEPVNVLVDLGTNGEMAIGNKDRILVTSTAAGPAFEGGNISCGMGSVKGAISQIEITGEEVSFKTIGDKEPIGLCGTGVIETAYELLKEEWIDETGMLDEDYFDDGFVLATDPDGDPISFTQKDVREIQLAKSAVRAGLETLILRYGVTYDDIDHLYLAGGFGFHMNLEKTVGIGLLPEELLERTVAVGNSSLNGAIAYLTDPSGVERLQHIIDVSDEVSLGADKDFNQFYTDYMFFE